MAHITYCTISAAKNKGTDQTAWMRRLIYTFVVCIWHKTQKTKVLIKGADQSVRMHRLIHTFVVHIWHKTHFHTTWLISIYVSLHHNYCANWIFFYCRLPSVFFLWEPTCHPKQTSLVTRKWTCLLCGLCSFKRACAGTQWARSLVFAYATRISVNPIWARKCRLTWGV